MSYLDLASTPPEPRFASVDTCTGCGKEYGSHSAERSALRECMHGNCKEDLCLFCRQQCVKCKRHFCARHLVDGLCAQDAPRKRRRAA